MSMYDDFYSEWAAHDRRVAEKQLNEDKAPEKRKELEEKLEKAKKAEAQEFWAQVNICDD